MKFNGFDVSTEWDTTAKTFRDRLSVVFDDMQAVHCSLPMRSSVDDVVHALHTLIAQIKKRFAQ